MKRIFTIIMAVFMILSISACKSSGTSVPEISKSFSASAEFVHNDKSSTGILTRNDNSWTLEMTSPTEIKGIKYSYIDGKSSASLGKLQVEGGQAENNFLLLVNVLEFTGKGEGISASKSNGKITATGRLNTSSSDKNFELLFSGNGQPEQVKVPAANLTVNLSGLTNANVEGEPADKVNAEISGNNESLEK